MAWGSNQVKVCPLKNISLLGNIMINNRPKRRHHRPGKDNRYQYIETWCTNILSQWFLRSGNIPLGGWKSIGVTHLLGALHLKPQLLVLYWYKSRTNILKALQCVVRLYWDVQVCKMYQKNRSLGGLGVEVETVHVV